MANISIKNVPDNWILRLRKRAKQNHRSLQGELMAILEKTLQSQDTLSPEELLDGVRQLDLHTPAEAADMVREDRLGH